MKIEHLLKASLVAPKKHIREALNAVLLSEYTTSSTDGFIAIHCIAEPNKTIPVGTPTLVPIDKVVEFLKMAKGCEDYEVIHDKLVSDKGHELNFTQMYAASFPDFERMFIRYEYSESLDSLNIHPSHFTVISKVFRKNESIRATFAKGQPFVKLTSSKFSEQGIYLYICQVREVD